MDPLELRSQLDAVRDASLRSGELLNQQLAILEAAVEELILEQPALPVPHARPSTRMHLSPEDAFFVEFEL